MTAMFNFFNGEAYDADIPALRKLHPGLLNFEQYLRKNGWENAEPIPMPEKSWLGVNFEGLAIASPFCLSQHN